MFYFLKNNHKTMNCQRNIDFICVAAQIVSTMLILKTQFSFRLIIINEFTHLLLFTADK